MRDIPDDSDPARWIKITRPLRQSILADRIANFIHVTSEDKNRLDHLDVSDKSPLGSLFGLNIL